MIIKFIVPGEPKAKGRPRMSTKTGRAYTPKTTLEYENLVKMCYMEQVGEIHTDKSLRATIRIYHGIPKSFSKTNKKKALEGESRPTKRPDIDNIVKAILDSLNNIAYHDDAQVIEILASKHYAIEPKVEVELLEI